MADTPTLTHGGRQIARRVVVVVGLPERDALATAGGTPPTIGPWLPSSYGASTTECGSSGTLKVVDTNGNLEQCTGRGSSPHNSGSAEPSWNTSTNGTTSDGNLTWTNKGAASGGQTTGVQAAGTRGMVIDNTYNQPAWVASHGYAAGNLITDSSGNVEKVTGCSGSGANYCESNSSAPTWTTTVGGTTTDYHVTWTNEGVNQTASIYFGTLGTTGNNAVKLTQKGLQ